MKDLILKTKRWLAFRGIGSPLLKLMITEEEAHRYYPEQYKRLRELKETKGKTRSIELTPREAYVLWCVACWFFKRPVTSTLKYRLFALCSNEERREFQEKCGDKIDRQMTRKFK